MLDSWGHPAFLFFRLESCAILRLAFRCLDAHLESLPPEVKLTVASFWPFNFLEAASSSSLGTGSYPVCLNCFKLSAETAEVSTKCPVYGCISNSPRFPVQYFVGQKSISFSLPITKDVGELKKAILGQLALLEHFTKRVPTDSD